MQPLRWRLPRISIQCFDDDNDKGPLQQYLLTKGTLAYVSLDCLIVKDAGWCPKGPKSRSTAEGSSPYLDKQGGPGSIPSNSHEFSDGKGMSCQPESTVVT